MQSSTDIIDSIVSITGAVAAKVRQAAWSQEYQHDLHRNDYVEHDDHHVAPLLDAVATEAMITHLDAHFHDYKLVTEEAKGHVVVKGTPSDAWCLIADPLDGSAFARRRIPLASVSLCVYCLSRQRPLVSAVTDVFLNVTYLTADHLGASFLRFDEQEMPIASARTGRLRLAAGTALGAQPLRFSALAAQAELTNSVRWIVNSGGALDICRVAAGDLDFSVEFAKGFRIWDVAAAGHILQNAGGVFGCPDGTPITLQEPVDKRFQFIAAANQNLFSDLTKAIRW